VRDDAGDASQAARGVSATRALARGLARRCPRCGRGKLFRRWLQLTTACPRCGLTFEREEGAFLGSLAINYGVTALAVIAYLVVVLVLTLPDPPVFALTAGAVGIAIVVPLFVYPFAKTTWAAIDYLLTGRT
jgi:uncharacterized protein (DUF983 family)